jgi:hypothetical protein
VAKLGMALQIRRTVGVVRADLVEPSLFDPQASHRDTGIA